MPKIIDHIQTGKTKFIKGPGRKKDVSLNHFEDGKNSYDREADNILFNKELNNPIKVKDYKEVKITDKISRSLLEKHYAKCKSGKKVKGLFRMYSRYGKFNTHTLQDFLKRRLDGQKIFKYYD